MTPAERDLLTRFLNDLAQARATPKDPEAASLIGQALNANPDGPYLLVQHTILADQALHAAQARIAELESQLRPAEPAPSFLGGGAGPWSGARPSTAVPPTSTPTMAAPAQQGGYATDPPLHQTGYGTAPTPGGPFSSGGGLGSFLRSAGTMAAGVAGGELLFGGLSNLFRPHYGGFGGGGFGGGFGGGYGPEENVVVNNYYDDDGPNDQGSWDNGGGGFDDGGSNGW